MRINQLLELDVEVSSTDGRMTGHDQNRSSSMPPSSCKKHDFLPIATPEFIAKIYRFVEQPIFHMNIFIII